MTVIALPDVLDALLMEGVDNRTIFFVVTYELVEVPLYAFTV